MRILYLTHRLPYPPDRGDRIRSYHTLKWLAAHHDVYLACFADEAPKPDSIHFLTSVCTEFYIERLSAKRWLSAAWSLARGRSITEGAFRSRRIRRQLRQWTVEAPFDAVIAFCSSMGQYLDTVDGRCGRRIVDLVDVDSEKWAQYSLVHTGLRRLVYRLESTRVRRLERQLASQADAVLCVSEQEAALFRSICPDGHVVALRNGVDTEYFRPSITGETDEHAHRCVFVGVLDYQANVDGLDWFCREVWPQVRVKVPDAAFHIVGKNPTAAVRRLGEIDGVMLVGPVPDVRPHLESAAVAIAPLRVARGIQNKVLEAMAMGKPVVATPEAREGLDVENGTHALLAASSQQFCDSIVTLLNSHTLRRTIGAAARARTVEHYGWDAALCGLSRLLLSHKHARICLDAPV